MSPESLDVVYCSYEKTKDGLRVAAHALKQALDAGDLGLVHRTVFVAMTSAEVGNDLEKCLIESSDLAVVALWAVFERELVQYVQRRLTTIGAQNPPQVAKRLLEKVDEEVEAWRTGELLDVFRDVVDVHLLGHAKNIKKYRDWVAHRNPRKATPAKTDPEQTHRVLTQILRSIAAEPTR